MEGKEGAPPSEPNGEKKLNRGERLRRFGRGVFNTVTRNTAAYRMAGVTRRRAAVDGIAEGVVATVRSKVEAHKGMDVIERHANGEIPPSDPPQNKK